jgi:hypothetical protein
MIRYKPKADRKTPLEPMWGPRPRIYEGMGAGPVPTSAIPDNAILTEDGDPILTEDGDFLLTET